MNDRVGKYYALFEQASDPMMVTDFNGNFVNVNSSFCTMFGYSREELVTMNIKQLIDAEEYKERPIRFDLLAEGQHIFSERKMVRRNGSIIIVEANAKRFDKDTVMAIARDVTELRRANRIIQESEARFRAAFENSAVGMALVSLEGKFLQVNKELSHILGYEAGELLNLTFQDISLPGPDADKGFDFYEQLLKNEIDVFTLEKQYKHKSGSEVWANLNVSAIKNPKGEPMYFVAHIQDITRRKNEELYREKISKDLLRQNKDLEQFAYIVSHNLRTPIANIIGLTQILSDDQLTPADNKDCLGRLEYSVERLDQVIMDLNHILQVQREVSEQKEKVVLSTLVEEIKSMMPTILAKEQVQLKTDFSVVNEYITLKSYLYSILYNLITNSIKYRRPDVSPVITIKSARHEGKLRLTYGDNGLGIDLQRYGSQVFGLYKRFYPHVEGKGMGLFMVKTQVETLGGNISISSVPNVGTEFVIEI